MDKYHRILGRIVADGEDLTACLIRRSLAHPNHRERRAGWCG
ncbi:MAG: hypothetical protein RRB13_07480 [bacterium]|nr:hypothetical protein [bacterium]